MRRGFSLIEVMIAIVILAVGILALAGTAGAVTKMIARGGRMGSSSVVAEDQLESLRFGICTSFPGNTTGTQTGTATNGRYSLSWTTTASAWARTVRLSVAYPNGRSTRTDVYETMISCAQ